MIFICYDMQFEKRRCYQFETNFVMSNAKHKAIKETQLSAGVFPQRDIELADYPGATQSSS